MLYSLIAILGFIQVYLTLRVVGLRRSKKVAIGDGDNILITRAIRAHANFTETVPISLILILILEYKEYGNIALAITSLLTLARLVHAYGISQVNENFKLRIFGTASTMITIISASSIIILDFIAKSL
jgi:uncharacterized membrane protein YecN with MAPEG domain